MPDRPASAEAGLMAYIYVNGIDEVAGHVVSRGGEIVKSPYPEGDLWVCTFRDPAGNLLGFWQMGPR